MQSTDSPTVTHPTASQPTTVPSLKVCLSLPNGDAEHYRYANATFRWTEHGTLLVQGRRLNGYDAPKQVETEYPAGVVTSVEHPS